MKPSDKNDQEKTGEKKSIVKCDNGMENGNVITQRWISLHIMCAVGENLGPASKR